MNNIKDISLNNIKNNNKVKWLELKNGMKINLEWLYPNKINNTRYLNNVNIDDTDIEEEDDDYVILTDEEVKKYFG